MSSQDPETGFHVEGEGTEDQTFACNTCDYKHKKEGPMKSHITKQHVKKKTAVVTETEEEALAALEEWNRPRAGDEALGEGGNTNATTTGANEVIVINDTTGQEGNLEQAVKRIKCLEEDLAAKEEVIKKIDLELATAKDLADIAE